MRRLAGELDVWPMALYNHVANRDDLLDAIADAFLATFRLPSPGLDSRIWTRRFSRSAWRQLVAHPHLAELVVARPVSGPATFEIYERFLTVMSRAGFDATLAHHSWHALQSLTLGFILEERDWGRGQTTVRAADPLPIRSRPRQRGKSARADVRPNSTLRSIS